VVSLSLFGSMARDEAEAGSDVDLVLRLDESLTSGGFAWFGRVADLRRRLFEIVGHEVDIVIEPIRKERLRREVERDRQLASSNPRHRFQDILEDVDAFDVMSPTRADPTSLPIKRLSSGMTAPPWGCGCPPPPAAPG
jgi:predicted nucleotidyltransferase